MQPESTGKKPGEDISGGMQRKSGFGRQEGPVEVQTLGRRESQADRVSPSTHGVGNIGGDSRNVVDVDGYAEALLKSEEGAEHRAKPDRHGKSLPGSGFRRRVITPENGVDRKVAFA